MKGNKLLIAATAILVCSCFSYANAFPLSWQGIAISYGRNHANGINGGRIAYQFLPKRLTWKYFSLHFHASAAYWHIKYPQYDTTVVLAFAPALRFKLPLSQYFHPYLEASIGPAFLTSKIFGGHYFGSHLMFQDMLGGGITFGNHRQFDLSYRFLHYSNGHWSEPNNGINIQQLFTFAYHFT